MTRRVSSPILIVVAAVGVMAALIGRSAAGPGSLAASTVASPAAGSPVATVDLLATVQTQQSTEAAGSAQTTTALATENAQLQSALIGLATSEAAARQAEADAQAQATAALGTAQAKLADAQATIANQATQIADLEMSATANALPTATPTETPTPTATPTETPTPTPVPPTATPTPLPQAGTVLYQAGETGGFESWSGGPEWKVVHGMLVNDGTNRLREDEDDFPQDISFFQPILAPFDAGTADYAIEAEIQFVGLSDLNVFNVINVCAYGSTFGIVARSGSSGGYAVGIAYPDLQDNPNAQDQCDEKTFGGTWDISTLQYNVPGRQGSAEESFAADAFDPETDWHTYRVEVDGNTITFIIDGQQILEVTDNRYLDPGQVGLWSDAAQINVRSFKLIAL